jgi:hypothetical protein
MKSKEKKRFFRSRRDRHSGARDVAEARSLALGLTSYIWTPLMIAETPK